jgi:hypothetical protein
MAAPVLVTKTEIARRLGVSRNTVAKLVNVGVLPGPLNRTKFYAWARAEEALRRAIGEPPPREA